VSHRLWISGVILFTSLLAVHDLAAQDDDYDYTYLNPGIRVGYTFGKGVTFGVELSFLVNNGFIVGAASGVDFTVGSGGSTLRLYLEGEVGFLAGGLGYGGAVLFDRGKLGLVRQLTLFAGWPIDASRDDRYSLLIPYYRVTYPPTNDKARKEVGTFLKYSYPVDKGDFGNRYDLGT